MMQDSYSSVSQPPNSVQHNSLNQTYVVGNNIVAFLLFFIPICLVLGATLYKKHRVHRAAILKQQIETLERLWRISYIE